MNNQGTPVLIENPNKTEDGKSVTQRGFRIDHFKDSYGHSCSLQKSSAASDDYVWLGLDEPEPQIMASNALKMGRTDLLTPGEPVVGWVAWPIPEEVLISTRMHLSREQVKALLPALQHFVDTGDLP